MVSINVSLQRDCRLPLDDSRDIYPVKFLRFFFFVSFLFLNPESPILNHAMQILPPTLEGLKT